ncbi:winged helix DNA-binding protein [Fodinicola acaciae]|uniref:winged helix DNA-binding protein n=1 Tax=Fodinicola acaciae TaxID=2681555 RepID=UPI0013D6758C|nr:winged helix DNA-binding protein [Fodinicola acaciae]
MQRPIGFWLQRLDGLIESRFAAELDGLGLTRRHWQVLNTVATGPVTRAEVDAAVAPFLAAAPADAQRCIDDLIARGWVADGQQLALTADGVAGHAAVATVVQRERTAIMDGISPDDYLRTVMTLERMAANLGQPLR